MKEYIEVGQILKPQGIKGEVKLMPLTDDPLRFEGENTFFLEENGAYTPVVTRFSRFDGQAVYLSVEGVNDRNAAEKLRGRYLLVDRAHAAQLDEDEFFIVDLIGIRGFDETGKSYGVLKEVMQPGGNDVYVFVDKAARKEYLIPALKSAVTLTDPEKGEMVFDSKRLSEVCVVNDI